MNKIHIQKMVHTNKNQIKKIKKTLQVKRHFPKRDDTCTSKPGGKRKTTISTFVRLDTCNGMKDMENRSTDKSMDCLSERVPWGQKQKRDNAFHSLFGRGRRAFHPKISCLQTKHLAAHVSFFSNSVLMHPVMNNLSSLRQIEEDLCPLAKNTLAGD